MHVIYVYMYIHTYIHTYIPTYLPTYLPIYLPTYLHTYIHTLHTYVHIHHIATARLILSTGFSHEGTATCLRCFGLLRLSLLV